MAGTKMHLLKKSKPSNITFVGSLRGRTFRNVMEHLTCFLPGTLALGYMHGVGGDEHLQMAKDTMRGCYEMYRVQPTGLGPEAAIFNFHAGATQDLNVDVRNKAI